MVVCLLWMCSITGAVWAQTNSIFDQLTQLKLNQPLPESLQKQAESVSKRGDKQTYYFLSGNYVYPHFVETQHGLIVHVAVYLDATKTTTYAQQLQAVGTPEIVLQNTENESIFGFPSKGMVYVVNNQKQPVVYEWMEPRTEREIVQTYDTETVLAAADTIETTSDPRELLLKYPAEVIAIAVGFYSTLISNPRLAVVGVVFIVAFILTLKIIRAVKTTAAQHRESRIAQLMEETRAINKQRELAAVVAETVMVPTQQLSTAETSAPVFDASTIESAESQLTAVTETNNTSQTTAMSHLTDEELAAASSTYALPAVEELEQMTVHNPQLKDQTNSDSSADGDLNNAVQSAQIGQEPTAEHKESESFAQ